MAIEERVLMALIVRAAGDHVRRLPKSRRTRDAWEHYVHHVIDEGKRTHRYWLAYAARRVLLEARSSSSIAAYEETYGRSKRLQAIADAGPSDTNTGEPPDSNTGVNSTQLILDIMGVK